MKKILQGLLSVIFLMTINTTPLKALDDESSNSESYNLGDVVNASCTSHQVNLSDDLQGLMIGVDDGLVLVDHDFKINTEFPVNDFTVIDDLDNDGVKDVFVYLKTDNNFDDLKIISAKTSKVLAKWKHEYPAYNDMNTKVIKNAKVHHQRYLDGIIYYLYNYHLTAYDPVKQKVVFDYEGVDNLWNYVVLENKILITNQLGQVIALDKKGKELYQVNLTDEIEVTVAYTNSKEKVLLNAWDIMEHNGHVYVTLEDSRLVEIDSYNGDVTNQITLDENNSNLLTKSLADNRYDNYNLAPNGIDDYEFMSYQMQLIDDNLMLVSGYFGNSYLNTITEDCPSSQVYVVKLDDFTIQGQFSLEQTNLISSNLTTGIYNDQAAIIVPGSFSDGKLKLLVYGFDGNMLGQSEISLNNNSIETTHIVINKVDQGYLLQAGSDIEILLDHQLKVIKYLGNGMQANKLADLSDGILVSYYQNNGIQMIRKYGNNGPNDVLMEFKVPTAYPNNGFEAINYDSNQNQILSLINETNSNQVVASHVIIMDLNTGSLSDHKVLLDQGYDENNRYYQNYLTGSSIRYFSDLNKDKSLEILVDDNLIDGATKAYKANYDQTFEGAGLVLEAGDVNQDGVVDLVNITENQMSIYYSKIDGYVISYEKSNIVKNYDKKLQNNLYAKNLGDLDHDGFNEIVINDYNERKCQYFQVLSGKDLSVKYGLMIDGVLDNGECFALTKQDYNQDGVDDLLSYDGNATYTIISGKDGSAIFNYDSYDWGYEFYSGDPVPLDYLVEFKIDESINNVLSLNDLDGDGINEYGYLYYQDSTNQTLLAIISGKDYQVLKEVVLESENYSDNNVLAIAGTNKIVYLKDELAQIYDYQEEKIIAGLKSEIKSARKLNDQQLLIETKQELMTFNDQRDFELVDFDESEESNGHLLIKYQSDKNGIMAIYDQGKLVKETSADTITLDLLSGNHKLLFSYNDGHGKITSYQASIEVSKSALGRYLVITITLGLLVGAYVLAIYPKYHLKKKAGKVYERLNRH